jgi:hypothetical protein
MGWDQLTAILTDRRRELEAESQQPPVACPNDGEPLSPDPDGRLHCDYDGYVWP